MVPEMCCCFFAIETRLGYEGSNSPFTPLCFNTHIRLQGTIAVFSGSLLKMVKFTNLFFQLFSTFSIVPQIY